MYIYPLDIAARLKAVWNESRRPGEQIPALPSDEMLAELLETAYHASFLAEEHRRIGFRIVYCSKLELQHFESRPAVHYLDQHPIEFGRHRMFSVAEIMRLAPATDLTRVMICVHEFPEPGGGEKLAIWGIIDTGSSWWEFMHKESEYAIPPPNLLTISSIEPGHLLISRADRILLNLRHGELSRPLTFADPVQEFFRPAQHAIYHEICAAMQIDRYDATDSAEDGYPASLYASYWVRLLFHIREKRHGGMLIVLPSEVQCPETTLTEQLLVKYRCTYDRVWRLVSEKCILHKKYYEQYIPVRDTRDPVPGDTFRTLVSMARDREHVNKALSDSVRFIASLSGVDGAVVITDRLRILGFGAEVIGSSTGDEMYRIAGEDVSHSIEGFGTRHRAAFRFCLGCEHALVFVISQDGDVKAIKKVGDDLVLWPDVKGALGLRDKKMIPAAAEPS